MKRSKMSLSYTHLLSCDMGELVPIGLLEVLPGDSIRMNTSALVRCAPMLAPPMHPVEVCIHHWFVPHRLVWDSWEAFITGGPTVIMLLCFRRVHRELLFKERSRITWVCRSVLFLLFLRYLIEGTR